MGWGQPPPSRGGCHLAGCRICAAEDEYRRDMVKIHNENCDMCRHAGIDRKMAHFDDRYGNMCDEHYEKFRDRIERGVC
jgi:hypothetical protein